MDEWDNGIKMISIIIPAHNEEMYIDGILSDLKRQRHKDFEVIVSDDFSEDRTAALARKSGLKGIRVIEHKSRNASRCFMHKTFLKNPCPCVARRRNWSG